MFIYFDRNGTLKEIITEQPFRNGDSERDKIYVYLENEELAYNGWIKYLLPDGTETNETQFYDGSLLNKVGKELPLNPPRNLKYFSYEHTYTSGGTTHTGYLFYEITVPDEVLNSAISEENNLVVARIRFINGNSIFTLGAVPFSVESNIGILTDTSLNETQYNYLLKLISDYTSDISNKVDFSYLTENYYSQDQSNARFALITEAGNKIVFSVDSTTYKITASLYDKNNNLISTSNEIDLPIENLQEKITSQNKLDADLVDDANSTHKFVNAEQIAKIGASQLTANLIQSVRNLASALTDKYPSEKAVRIELDTKQDKTIPSIIVNGSTYTNLEDTIVALNQFLTIIDEEVRYLDGSDTSSIASRIDVLENKVNDVDNMPTYQSNKFAKSGGIFKRIALGQYNANSIDLYLGSQEPYGNTIRIQFHSTSIKFNGNETWTHGTDDGDFARYDSDFTIDTTNFVANFPYNTTGTHTTGKRELLRDETDHHLLVYIQKSSLGLPSNPTEDDYVNHFKWYLQRNPLYVCYQTNVNQIIWCPIDTPIIYERQTEIGFVKELYKSQLNVYNQNVKLYEGRLNTSTGEVDTGHTDERHTDYLELPDGIFSFKTMRKYTELINILCYDANFNYLGFKYLDGYGGDVDLFVNTKYIRLSTYLSTTHAEDLLRTFVMTNGDTISPDVNLNLKYKGEVVHKNKIGSFFYEKYTTYEANQVVYYNGYLFMCKATSLNNTPDVTQETTYWKMITV